LDNHRGAENAPALANAVSEYVAARGRDHVRQAITLRQLKSIRFELTRFLAALPEATIAGISSESVQTYLENLSLGKKSWNNVRGYLSTFFRYCVSRDWLSANPIDRVQSNRLSRARGVAETLTARQSSEIMAYLETHAGGRLVNHFALTLFAGIRPDFKSGELSRFKPDFVNFETNMIILPPSATKTNELRKISLTPNLKAWLVRYPLESFPPVPKNVVKLRLAVRKQFALGHDVLRHTFISMLVARDRSVGDAALQAGNSESVVRKHYLDVKSAEEAARFWGIIPTANPN
jgi:integrase